MKKTIIRCDYFLPFLFSCCFSFCMPGPVLGVVCDRVVATVNDQVITLTELEEKARPVLDKYLAEGDPEAKKKEILAQILPQVVDEYLVQGEIAKRGIVVGDAEVDAAIERICAENRMGRDDLVARLQEEGLTLEQYRGELKEQIERARLIDAEVRGKIVVTDEQVDAYMRGADARSAGEDARFVIEHIGVVPKDPGDPAARKSARERIDAAYKALKDGKAFSEVAASYSDFPSGKEGGYLGTFSPKEMAPVVRDAVRDLSPGGYSGVVDTAAGYQIFRLREINLAGETPSDPAKRDEIRQKIYRQQLNARFDEWLGGLRAKSSIRILY